MPDADPLAAAQTTKTVAALLRDARSLLRRIDKPAQAADPVADPQPPAGPRRRGKPSNSRSTTSATWSSRVSAMPDKRSGGVADEARPLACQTSGLSGQ
jgi:hypothetical protein